MAEVRWEMAEVRLETAGQIKSNDGTEMVALN
jgi:hypothetical protein